MRKHGGPPSRRDKHVTLAAISPPGVARGRFVGGQKSGLAGCKPPPLFTRGASSCSSQGRRQGEPWGPSPRPSAPAYLPRPCLCRGQQQAPFLASSTCPRQPPSRAGGDSPRGWRGHHGDGKADQSTESDRTRRGAAHQCAATRHAREACRRPQPQHEDRCQATTATRCRKPRKRAQHMRNHGTGEGAKDSRAPTPAHRTQSQWVVGPGRTPQGTGGRGWGSAQPRTPHTQAKGAPPGRPRAALKARKARSQERALWGW